MAAPGQVVRPAGGVDGVGRASVRRPRRVGDVALAVVSVVAALVVWELVTRTGIISETDLPAASTTVDKLWSLAQTSHFWTSFVQTVRGWALGLVLATVLAVPLGIFLGTNQFALRALRVPIEFLRPIPSAALIPLLFLTLGTTLQSEIFLATFGAFWPLLIQTIYGVRDVDPLALDTGRSFGLGRFESLYRITLPSAVPYILTGFRIASQVSLILAFTAELFMGIPGLGQEVNYASSYGLHEELYAYALATGILGLAIHFSVSAAERRVLRWHPSQRGTAS